MKKGICRILVFGVMFTLLNISSVSGTIQDTAATDRNKTQINRIYKTGKAVSTQKDLENLLSDQAARKLIRTSDISSVSQVHLVHMETGSFSKAAADELLCVFEITDTPHTGGLDRKVMAVFSNEYELLAAQILEGDDIELYHLLHQNGRKYILVSSFTVYQGIETQKLAMYRVNGRNFKQVFVDRLELGEDVFAAFAGNGTLVCYSRDMQICEVLKWDGKKWAGRT